MGHYDDCYEEMEDERLERERDNLIAWVNSLSSLSVEDLSFLKKMQRNKNDIEALIRVLNLNFK